MFSGLFLFLVAIGPNNGVHTENFGKIVFHMPREEVVKLLGCPAMFGPGEYQEFQFWYTSTSSEIMRQGELWISGNVKMWVVFDQEGRVTGVMGPNISDSFWQNGRK
jgi:hypothetical protein